MVELSLEGIVIIVGWLLSLAVALLAVPHLAGKKSEDRLVSFLGSPKAEPLWDKAAERVMIQLEPRLTGVEARIAQPVQFDMGPVVADITERVTAEVTKIRAAVDGRLGWLSKIGKQTGEAIAEVVGEEAAEDAGPEAMMARKIMGLSLDPKWAREHQVAAFGLEMMRTYAAGAAGSGAGKITRSGPRRGSGEF